jgi:zinc finger SWIM domain-containing protein 3
LFPDEFKLFLTLSVPTRHESDSLCEYVITKAKHEGSWRVSFNCVSNSITCSCKKLFELNDVKAIPKNYIFKRWTREARYGVVQDFRGKEIEGDPNLSRNRMFRQIVSKFIKAATEASPKEEWLKFLNNGVHDMFKKIMELRAQAMENNGNNGARPENMSSDVIQAKGVQGTTWFKAN